MSEKDETLTKEEEEKLEELMEEYVEALLNLPVICGDYTEEDYELDRRGVDEGFREKLEKMGIFDKVVFRYVRTKEGRVLYIGRKGNARYYAKIGHIEGLEWPRAAYSLQARIFTKRG
ncbi:MAG: hypothetical protein QXW42_04255 [Thermofilum sp.]